MVLKILVLTVLSVMLLSLGMISTASSIQPRWSYISSVAYLFEKDQVLADYDILACGGDTTVAGTRYAYVKVELQYLRNGVWTNYAVWEDEGRAGAGVEEYIRVTPGYTYRLLTTHKAMDANGNVLETFNDQSDYYIASLPRN